MAREEIDHERLKTVGRDPVTGKFILEPDDREEQPPFDYTYTKGASAFRYPQIPPVKEKEDSGQKPDSRQTDEVRDAVSHIRRLFSATDEVNAATLAGIMQMHGADIGRNRLYDLMEKGGYVRRTSTGEYACTPKGLESGLRDAATDMWDKGKTPSGVEWRQPLISEKFAIAVTKKILGSMNQ